MMQALVPILAIVGVAAGAQLTLLPYAYLADPLPVYHQSQDTRIGVHAYSYAGGPSAKEEVRGLDGVTRGSYSYLDAHGILQSVFYVADEGGFRVAATNLPSDDDLPRETGGVLLAKNAHLREHAKAAEQGADKVAEGQEEARATSRRKRSLEASADQDQAEKPSSQAQDQADRDSSRDSHEIPAPEKKAAEPVGLVHSVLIPKLTESATSHQDHVNVRDDVRLKAVQPLDTIGQLVYAEPAYKTLLLPAQLPLATSHQSRLQLHSNLYVETPQGKTEVVQPQAPAVAAVKLQSLPVIDALADYNENRIQLHKILGLEGPNRKDAVKIDAAQIVASSEETLPVVGAQLVHNADLRVAVPIEPAAYVAASYGQPITTTWPIYAPIAQSSQYRSQIHSSEKIELAK